MSTLERPIRDSRWAKMLGADPDPAHLPHADPTRTVLLVALLLLALLVPFQTAVYPIFVMKLAARASRQWPLWISVDSTGMQPMLQALTQLPKAGHVLTLSPSKRFISVQGSGLGAEARRREPLGLQFAAGASRPPPAGS